MPVVGVLAFTAGFCIMSLELLGGRILAPFFGNSIYVWGSIITVFMLPLSGGYLLGGRWSLHTPSVRRLAILFASSAILIAIVVSIATPTMRFFADTIGDARYGALLASLVMFLPPSVIMGMVSPYCVRLGNPTSESSGNVAGTLYFISTLGSALGTIMTSFYFVVWFPIDTILFGIAIVMFCGAFLAYTSAPKGAEKRELS